MPIAASTPDRTIVTATAGVRSRGARWSATMTSGSSSASRPTGVRNGPTQVMASATNQVATTVTPAAHELRSRAASSSAVSSRMPAATRAVRLPTMVRDGPRTTRSTTRAMTEDQMASRLTCR